MNNEKEKIVLPNKIVELYQKGYSSKDISNVFDISALTVRKYLRAAGVDTRNYRKVSDNNKEKIILLVKNGYSYHQIESLLQISFHLIREVVEKAGLIGFAPKYYHPIKLNVSEDEISKDTVEQLHELYCSGEYGLAKCAELIVASNEDFLWYIFHLTENDKEKHNKQLGINIKKMRLNNVPETAIAKKMDISPSIVKKVVSEL